VVHAGLFHLDLPEASYLLAFKLPKAQAREEMAKDMVAFDFPFERQFGAGKQAYRHVRFSDRREATRAGVAEACRYKFVSDLGGPGRDVVKTVIAHRRSPSL
jgi:hypothetical protein